MVSLVDTSPELAIRKFHCRAALRLIETMVERNWKFHDVDVRLGWSSGRTKQLLCGLLDGKTATVSEFALMSRALGLRSEFMFTQEENQS